MLVPLSELEINIGTLLNSRVYSDFTSFPTIVLFLFHDPIQDTTLISVFMLSELIFL